MKKIFIIIIGILFIFSCAKKVEVATVGEKRIFESQIEERLNDVNPQAVQNLGENEVKKRILNALIAKELILKELKDKLTAPYNLFIINDDKSLGIYPDSKEEIFGLIDIEKDKGNSLVYFINKWFPDVDSYDEESLLSLNMNKLKWFIYMEGSWNLSHIENVNTIIINAISLKDVTALKYMWDKRLFDIANSPHIKMVNKLLSDNLDVKGTVNYIYSLAIDINKSLEQVVFQSTGRKHLIDQLFVKWNSLAFILSLIGLDYTSYIPNNYNETQIQTTPNIIEDNKIDNNKDDIERILIIELIKRRHQARRESNHPLIKEIEDLLLLSNVRITDEPDGSTTFYK